MADLLAGNNQQQPQSSGGNNIFGQIAGALNPFTGAVNSIAGAVNAVAGLGGITGTIKSLFGSRKAERRAIQQQKDMMQYSSNLQQQMFDYQSKVNYDSWLKQQEYNAPTAQMARLKAAGLNPNLMYGNGADTGNAASPAAAGSGGSFNSNVDAKVASGLLQRQSDIEMMRQMKELALLDSQIDLNEANANNSNTGAGLNNAKTLTEANQRDYLDAQTALAKADAAYKEWKKGIDEQKAPHELKLLQQQYENAFAEYQEIFSRIYLNDSSRHLNEQQHAFNDKMNPKLLDEKQKQIDNLVKEGDKIVETINLLKKQGKVYDAQVQQLHALAEDLLASAGKTKQETQKIIQETTEMITTFQDRLYGKKLDNLLKEKEGLEKELRNKLLQNDVDWYVADKLVDYFTSVIPFAPGSSGRSSSKAAK